jgi:hypothetical protein
MARRDTAPSFERVQSSWYHLYFALHTIRDIDGLSPIPENTDQIYIGNMMDDYGEVVMAYKGRVSGSYLRIGR